MPLKNQKHSSDDEDFQPAGKGRATVKSPKKKRSPTVVERDKKIVTKKATQKDDAHNEKHETKKRNRDEDEEVESRKKTIAVQKKKDERSEKPKSAKMIDFNSDDDGNVSGVENLPSKRGKVTYSEEQYKKLEANLKSIQALRIADKQQRNELKQSFESAKEAREEYISRLKQEIDQLKKDKQQTKEPNNTKDVLEWKEKCSEASAAKEKAEEKLRATARLLAFYQQLCSVRMHSTEQDRYECEAFHTSHTHRKHSFQLLITEKEIEYLPLNRAKTAAVLPEFLRDNIVFEEDQLPKFLVKLLQHIYANTE